MEEGCGQLAAYLFQLSGKMWQELEAPPLN